MWEMKIILLPGAGKEEDKECNGDPGKFGTNKKCSMSLLSWLFHYHTFPQNQLKDTLKIAKGTV